ncbi:hypothetical protein M0804_014276 [Polistes exclamans]|nr:hypothetical protein M0804_014277 [Polistes exclamans]KAI4475492.1 hypothetical protein M0804_014276 [Polistes exclamans]
MKEKGIYYTRIETVVLNIREGDSSSSNIDVGVGIGVGLKSSEPSTVYAPNESLELCRAQRKNNFQGLMEALFVT